MNDLSNDDKADVVKGLRDLADFLEAHPEAHYGGALTCDLFVDTKEELAKIARDYAPVEKDATQYYFYLRKKFGKRIKIEWNVNREKCCRQVVTGKKTVTLPPQEALPERIEEVEIKEWVCDEPLLSSREQVEAIPVTKSVDPIADQIEAEPLNPADRQEILDALDLDTWTETSETHTELPDHLKPKRKPIWDLFDAGWTPDDALPHPNTQFNEIVELEYTRWKLAGGKVKQ